MGSLARAARGDCRRRVVDGDLDRWESRVRGEDFVRSVADVYGWAVRTVEFIENAGSVNHVARVDTTDGEVVVRHHRDPKRTNEFPVESWCARAAAAVGLPTPASVDGVLDGTPYGVQEWIDGTTPPPTQDVWVKLGEYARLIATVELTDAPDGVFGRFGRALPQAWQAHVEYNLAALGQDDELIDHGLYRSADRPRIAALLQKTLSGTDFGLSHGDLTPQNLLRDTTGRLILIDRGCARTGPVPWLDAVVTAGRESCGAAPAGSTGWFFRGYGTAPEMPVLDAHRLLARLDLMWWALDQRPDLLEHHREAATLEVRRALEHY